MNQLPIIETNRLILRTPVAEDIPNIILYANNPAVAMNTLNIPFPYTEKDAINWLSAGYQGLAKGTEFIFGIEEKDSNTFIGGISLKVDQKFNRAEVGFWLGEQFWNMGLMTEALKSILEFGFKVLDLHKVDAHHLVNNVGSGRTMEKNGMIREGEMVDHVKKGEQYVGIVLYRLTREEYDALM